MEINLYLCKQINKFIRDTDITTDNTILIITLLKKQRQTAGLTAKHIY